jgi:hypothetical protein
MGEYLIQSQQAIVYIHFAFWPHKTYDVKIKQSFFIVKVNTSKQFVFLPFHKLSTQGFNILFLKVPKARKVQKCCNPNCAN